MSHDVNQTPEQVARDRIDGRLRAVDWQAQDKDIDTALARADALHQSILKKAFAGELVPQDPDDEPASILLRRIRAERAEAPARRQAKRIRA